MKIVINDCFGGFGLSTEAMKQLIKLGSAGIETMTELEYRGGRARGDISSETFSDAGDGFEVGWIEDVLYRDGMVYSFDDDFRTDPVLIRVVEQMGGAADGSCAELKVIEIPDDVDWEICEYDGNEHIAEKHRTWS